MYSFENDTYTLLGVQKVSHIENESNIDYENRVIYVCKDICQDYINTDLYKNNKRNISNIKVILTNPWCIYEIINLEKNLEKKQAINQNFINNLIVHKEHENLSIIRNNVFNITLNGYNVDNINNQIAQNIHIQYLSIYSSANFLSKLKNTLETIFHLHKIEIDSIYSFINDLNFNNSEPNELRVVIEDNNLDLTYIHNKKIISTFFIPCGCVNIKNKLKESLHIDDVILDKILKSKATSKDTIWNDLSSDIKIKIDEQINISLEFIKIQMRNFVDDIDNEFLVKNIKVNIYSLDENSLYTLGFILSDNLKSDGYMLDRLLTNELNIFTKKIF